eukprot:4877347-Prymnesium_polylepis.1
MMDLAPVWLALPGVGAATCTPCHMTPPPATRRPCHVTPPPAPHVFGHTCSAGCLMTRLPDDLLT